MTTNRAISTKDMVLSALFAALIAVGAFIKVPIPIMPFTLQFLFSNLAGILLGKKYGAISAGVYISVGLLGLPVFTNGGGIGYVVQPTFGYLLGFMLGAYWAGFVVEKCNSYSKKTLMLAGLANLVAVYGLGTVYFFFIMKYYLHTPIGLKALFINCFLITIPGDLLTCGLCAVLGKRLHSAVRRKIVK